MHIQRKRTTKKRLFVAFALFLVAFIAIALAYHFQTWPFQSPQETIQQKLEKQNKSDATNPTTKAESAKASDDVDSSKTTDDIPTSASESIEITKLIQSGGAITYEAKINGTSGGGTCSAVYSNDIAKPVTRTSDANGDMCGPVSISAGEFSTLGTWTLTLRYYSNNTQVVTSKKIDIS